MSSLIQSGIGGPISDPSPTSAGTLHVPFPLWVKLGALFGLLLGSSFLGFGLWTVDRDVEQERGRLRLEMEAVAVALAAGIDGDVYASFQVEQDRGRPSFQMVVRQLDSVVQTASSVTWAGACRREDDGRWTWVVEHTNENAYPVGFPIFDAESARNEAIERDEVVYRDVVEDEAGRWRTVWAPIRSSTGRVVGLVEVVADADRDLLIAAVRRNRLYLQVGLATLGSLALAFLFGRALSSNLMQLVRAAQAIADGDLSTRVDIHSRDEVGALAQAFNHMVDGLREREFIRDTFGRFVNPDVVAGILADRDVSLGGEAREVTVLMSDLRGFTALSEELGPERMVALLNRYLSRMTEVVVAHGGNVAELLGDGIVVLFGAPVAHDDDPQRAARCAVAMLEALQQFNLTEDRNLEMGIGIDTGVVIAGNIGSAHHMKYGVVGEAINLASRIEAFTVGNQILVSDATAKRLSHIELGAAETFRPKGRSSPLVVHPVLAIEGAWVDDATEALVEVELSGSLWRLSGKSIDMTSEPVRVVQLGHRTLVLEGTRLPARAKVKLDVTLPGGVEVLDLYATVEHTQPLRLHLTSVSDDARRRLAEVVEAA